MKTQPATGETYPKSDLFNKADVRLNIVSLQESLHLDIAKLWQQLNFHQQVQTGSMGDMFAENTALTQTDSAEYQLLMRTLKRFVNAKTLGSLIQIPQEEEAELKVFLDALYRLEQEGDFQQKAAAKAFIPFIQQAWILAQRYDAVVANPPYMGSKGMNGELKEFAKNNFPDSKSDLFAMFIERGFLWLKNAGFNSMVTMQSWMFLSSFENMRKNILTNYTIETMVHMGNGVMKIAFGTNATVFRNTNTPSYKGSFSYAENDDINEKGYPEEFPVKNERLKNATASDFKKIPGYPIAYWVNPKILSCFTLGTPVQVYSVPRQGFATGNNDLFLRRWSEISLTKFSQFNSYMDDKNASKWFPCNKGGAYRKWFGNNDLVVNWDKNGAEMKSYEGSVIRNERYYFKEGITWSTISSSYLSMRYSPEGFLFETKGSVCFSDNQDSLFYALALMNSPIAEKILEALSPTLDFHEGPVGKVPVIEKYKQEIVSQVRELIELSKSDWDEHESSWSFKNHPLLDFKNEKISNSYNQMKESWQNRVVRTQLLETKNNQKLLETYNLLGLIEPNVSISKIALDSNSTFKYPNKNNLDEINHRQCSDIFSELTSYIIGCQMGRYSLDREGLVYAHEGNKGFADLVAEGAYKTFPADSDGILPLMDDEWFEDDVTSRVKEFVRTVWGEEHLQENLEFIAESLCLYAIKPKKGESALETIRRYLSTQFWKDHMKMYKKRPIYWLFSSGKEKAFECLVYLHRYNDATLSRMRTEYVVPLLARYQANIDRLNDQLDEASGGEATRLKRERDSLIKKFSELRSYDDRLRHYADMRISIDLDDGVKVNYGKFGDLLADVKAITGNAPEVI
ncbi:BREX-1 system adenine-specific DNA-methyltransferase PglX [Escherichia coli]|nr:BREX-1 system adenine-specific DNA-methyltransferase PglX [Escherichia coli]EIG7344798.1 BREX-1 system adenine-specific DNA-methyltransferase PglX [Escherichia coli]PBQ55291.1 class I SAM-dependent DNA methyltransferase [Escherichia coli]HCP7627876.1 BREX-1 system adenine-specific DNA-methyltransferase PglX [Escherichia coli]